MKTRHFSNASEYFRHLVRQEQKREKKRSELMSMPSDAAILERAFSLANQEMFTIALQCRRLRSTEPEDETFVFRWWADLQFLIVALWRLYRAAELAGSVPSAQKTISAALENFNNALPSLHTMRNVGEHIDEYARDKGREKDIKRGSLQVGD